MIYKLSLMDYKWPLLCKSDIEIWLNELNNFMNQNLDLKLLITYVSDISDRICINLRG